MQSDGPFGHEAELAAALKRLGEGATAGMAVKHLQRMNVPRHKAVEIVEAARGKLERKKRAIAWSVAGGGLLLILAGPALFFLLLANGWFAVKPAVIVAMFGLMVCMYGVVNAVAK